MIQLMIETDGTMRGIKSSLTEELQLSRCRRVSHIEPVHPVLRWVFHSIRRRVSDTSRLAAFTRKWPCQWRASIFDGPVLGPFSTRAAAVAAEVAFLNTEMERLSYASVDTD